MARTANKTIALVGQEQTAITLADALDNSALDWATNGTARWYCQATESHDGSDAARSGAVSHGQSSSLQATVSGPGTISFFWKVSSEANYDKLTFTVDGSILQTVSGSMNQFTQVTKTIAGTGNHSLKWTYAKDYSVSRGSDCGWVDCVVWTPAQTSAETDHDTQSGNDSAEENSPLQWSTTSTNGWILQNAEVCHEEYAMQSGEISHNMASIVQTEVEGAGTLEFDWKVSSERNYDKLRGNFKTSAAMAKHGAEERAIGLKAYLKYAEIRLRSYSDARRSQCR